MSRKIKIYILLGLCLVMMSCHESCESTRSAALDSNRILLAGSSNGIYKFNPSPALVTGSGGGQFTQILEAPRYVNSALQPALPSTYQPGLIGISQWGITRWGPTGAPAMDFPLSSTPFNAVLDPNQFMLYTSHPSEGEIQKFDLSTNMVVKYIQLPGTQPMFMTSPYDCSFIGFIDALTHLVSLFSPKTDSVVGSITPSGMPSGLGFTPDGRQLWVLDTTANSISTWEPRTASAIGKIPIANPTSILFTRDGTDAYVTSGASPFSLLFINTETYQIDNQLTLDEKPLRLAQDLYGSTLWIQNVSGTVTAIDPIRYSVIGKTPAASGTPLSLFSSSLALQF